MPTTIAELVESYLKGPADLRRHVAGMTREQMLERPVPGKWSTLEVIAHIADFEPILADRVKRTIALTKPTLLAADEN
ncbi:MAG: DinB family protein, partial [Planctomycetota bacterium]